jgi:hypothetical protein
MKKTALVRLATDERQQLQRLPAVGRAPTRQLTHARILLKADEGPDGPAWPDKRIAEALDGAPITVGRVRQRYAAEGVASALAHHPPSATRPRRLDGEQEAQLVALACTTPPPGRERWSLRLLADKAVELQIVDTISHETVRQALKQTL